MFAIVSGRVLGRVGARVESGVVCGLPARGMSEEKMSRSWRVCLLRLQRGEESGGMMPSAPPQW